jgi:hypothetical protein
MSKGSTDPGNRMALALSNNKDAVCITVDGRLFFGNTGNGGNRNGGFNLVLTILALAFRVSHGIVERW